jgi:hypothetical protein
MYFTAPQNPAVGVQTNVSVLQGRITRRNLIFIPRDAQGSADHATPAPEPLKPGVYETKPYSSIVLVPGPHPDDKMVFGMDRPKVEMPTKRPDLDLRPRIPGSGLQRKDSQPPKTER